MSEPQPAEEPADSSPSTVLCPHCQGALEVTLDSAPQIALCPHCEKNFMLPAADGSTLPIARLQGADAPANTADDFHIVNDEAEASKPEQRDDLDGRRIQQIALGRRAAYRSRSYCLIGAALGLVGAVQLVWNAVASVRVRGWNLWAGAYLLAAVICLWLGQWLFRRADRFKHEALQSVLEEPSTPPDLSSLGDGNERWKDLD